jgi:hypothetical protein
MSNDIHHHTATPLDALLDGNVKAQLSGTEVAPTPHWEAPAPPKVDAGLDDMMDDLTDGMVQKSKRYFKLCSCGDHTCFNSYWIDG